MARTPRTFVAGIPAHVVQRGNNRAPCFFGPGDHALYLSLLARIAGETTCQIHAYVLMTNHVHVLATPTHEHDIPLLMQRLTQRYTLAVNRKYERSGSLWQGRYRAFNVESDEYVIACHAYIELNPVRAGIVREPGEYRWSSYGANSGRDDPGFLTPHPAVTALAPTVRQARAAYQERVFRGIDETTLAGLRDGHLRPALRPPSGCQARA